MSQRGFQNHSQQVRLAAEEVPEDIEKETVGGEGLALNVYATTFDLPTFEHAFCPNCSAGLRRQVGEDFGSWEPIAE
jgi:hypothetical protein